MSKVQVSSCSVSENIRIYNQVLKVQDNLMQGLLVDRVLDNCKKISCLCVVHAVPQRRAFRVLQVFLMRLELNSEKGSPGSGLDAPLSPNCCFHILSGTHLLSTRMRGIDLGRL